MAGTPSVSNPNPSATDLATSTTGSELHASSVQTAGVEGEAGVSPSSAPVIRKFLCSAPRPEQWEAYSYSVLENLGSNAVQALTQTISKIRSVHNINPKMGPGRKSNSVHALLFYEYLLDRANILATEKYSGKEDGEELNDDDGDEDDDQSDSVRQPALLNYDRDDHAMALLTDEEFIAQHKKVCEVCEDPTSNEPLLLCSTCNLVFHVPCFRPVLEALPPEDETWRCSYCVLASEPKHTKPRRVSAAAVRLMARMRNQHKRNRGGNRKAVDTKQPSSVQSSKKPETILRRGKMNDASDSGKASTQSPIKSSVAVVAGGSSRKKPEASQTFPAGKEETAKFDSPARDKKRDPKASAVATSKNSPNSKAHDNTDDASQGDDKKDAGTPTSSASSRKRSLELYKLSGSWSPGLDVESVGSPLGKRVRKQPALYDPQNGPARKWKSDEVPIPSSRDGDSSSDDENDSDSSAASNKPESGKVEGEADEKDSELVPDTRRVRGSAVWCNFCLDDPGIKICCFCACRVCFGKKSKNKLLICDSCNDEYHTYCLDPPLESVPLEEKWFCPTCKEANERRAARTSSRLRVSTALRDKTEDEPPSPRRSSNRVPPVKKESDSNSIASSSRGSGAGAGTGTGRPRGRPRKHPLPDPTTVITGKKRGRPPGSGRSPSLGPPRKRGRPPKSKSPSSPGRATARPSTFSDSTDKKSIAGDPAIGAGYVDVSDPSRSSAVSVTEMVQIPVTVSRSGRTVKRSSFHDEIDQGNQQLRASRVVVEPLRKSPASIGTVSTFATTQQAVMEGVTASVPTEGASSVSLLVSSQTMDAAASTSTGSDGRDFVNLGSPANVLMSQNFLGTSSQPMDVTPAAVPVVANVAGAMAGYLQTMPSSFDDASASLVDQDGMLSRDSRAPRRKPGARECMQLSRRFGSEVISETNMEILIDYCKRGKCEHLIRMRERLDEHSLFLESQLAGLEALVREQSAADSQTIES